jgi:hypothetical protein
MIHLGIAGKLYLVLFLTGNQNKDKLNEDYITTFHDNYMSHYIFVGIVVCVFVLFLFAIVSSVLLRYTDSDYQCGICKLFFPVLFYF